MTPAATGPFDCDSRTCVELTPWGKSRLHVCEGGGNMMAGCRKLSLEWGRRRIAFENPSFYPHVNTLMETRELLKTYGPWTLGFLASIVLALLISLLLTRRVFRRRTPGRGRRTR